MGRSSPDDWSEETDENVLVKLTSLLVLGAGLLAMFLDVENFWLVFVLGFAVVLPAVKVVTDELGLGPDSEPQPESGTDSTSKQDALDTLRERYARGDLTEAEFERKVESLLETESPESARKHVERATADATTDDLETGISEN